MSGDSEPTADQEPQAKRRKAHHIAALAALCAAALAAALLMVVRFGVLAPPVRTWIAEQANGMSIGRFGRLGVEGLSGDIWRDVSVARLTISDDRGVWLEADGVRLRWRPLRLLRRRFHATELDVRSLQLRRRPHLGPSGPPSPNPVSVQIDRARARVVMEPAFSTQRGVYDVALGLNLGRRGGERGRVQAASLLHAGDHLNVAFDVTRSRPLVVHADAVEARGGALAGALGLPANQPFQLKIDAGGRPSNGRFTAVAISGVARPLEASGSWSPEGGQARGRISLTASSLTAPFANRLGPEVRFIGSGRKDGADLYALQAQAAADNLSLEAHGLGDLGERRLGPQGVTLTFATAALSRLVGGPQLGPARVVGVLTGAGSEWRFAGSAAAERLALGDYNLDLISGPVQLDVKPSAIDLSAKLSSRGGHGSGWIPAFFGGAPTAVFEGSRLADGRLALRKLQVNGSGVKLQVSGGRGLLGGLDLKGEAELSNLAAAHAGASGAGRVVWSASQARAGRPWNATIDARADKFATGYPELDRLLGARPHVSGEGALQGKRLALSRANLEGAAVKLAAAGEIGLDGPLALKLDWSAEGPFHAGPVEIAGHVKGGGAVTGSLSSPRADLLADVDALDVPRLPLKNAHVTLSFLRQSDGASGVVAMTAQSGYGPAAARSAFRFPEGGVDLTGLELDAGGVKAKGALSLRRAGPSAADLTLDVERGAFLDAGRVGGSVRLAEAAGGPHATLDLAAQGARLPGSSVTLTSGKLTADGALAHLPFTLAAQGRAGFGAFSADGRGVASQAAGAYGASFEGAGRVGGRELHTLEPAVFRIAGAERTARLRLAAADGGRLNLDGRLSDKDADVQASLGAFNLQLLNEDLAGRVDGSVRLQGQGRELAGQLEARLSGVRGRGAPANSAVDSALHGRLAGETLTLEASAANGQQLTASANVALPAVASAAPFRLGLVRDRPLSGRFAADGEIGPLFDLLVGGERSLAGRVRAQGDLAGSLGHPTSRGQVTLASGRFDDGQTGLSLRNFALQADFDQNAVDVTQASGVDGHGGSVTGSGRISLERAGASSFRLALKQFRLIDNELATASATGQATVARGADGKVKVSGDLLVDHADVAARAPSGSNVVVMDVVEKNRPENLPDLQPPSPSGGGWALDVNLRAPGHVLLRGRGLNVELSLDAHVGGTTSSPVLTGQAHVVRGEYDFAGKRFDFDPSSTVYLSTHASDIRLDLTASLEATTLTAYVRIRGTAARPEITLSSIPNLPSDEVLSQVLFGTSAAQLSPLQAAQLASAVSSLARGGGLDVIGNLRSFARLDRLAFGSSTASNIPGQQNAFSIAGGKYLTDNVYLELAGGGREGSYAQVEWQVRRTLSIISRLGGQGGSMLSFRWRRSY